MGGGEATTRSRMNEREEEPKGSEEHSKGREVISDERVHKRRESLAGRKEPAVPATKRVKWK